MFSSETTKRLDKEELSASLGADVKCALFISTSVDNSQLLCSTVEACLQSTVSVEILEEAVTAN